MSPFRNPENLKGTDRLRRTSIGIPSRKRKSQDYFFSDLSRFEITHGFGNTVFRRLWIGDAGAAPARQKDAERAA